MAINFKIKEDNSKPTKEELKIHIIENLLEKKFLGYNNNELRDSMKNGNFDIIYKYIHDKVFNEE